MEPCLRVDMPDGRSIWLSTSGTPLLDNRGEVRHIVPAFENVTERKQRERRFDAVFNHTFPFTGLMKPDGTLTEANDTGPEFAGAEREAVVGTYLVGRPWVTDESRDRVYDAADRAREGELVRFGMETGSARRNGTVPIDRSLKPFHDEAGEVVLPPEADGFHAADEGPGIPPEERRELFEHGSTDGSGPRASPSSGTWPTTTAGRSG